mgnify:CR=1 FL=1
MIYFVGKIREITERKSAKTWPPCLDTERDGEPQHVGREPRRQGRRRHRQQLQRQHCQYQGEG